MGNVNPRKGVNGWPIRNQIISGEKKFPVKNKLGWTGTRGFINGYKGFADGTLLKGGLYQWGGQLGQKMSKRGPNFLGEENHVRTKKTRGNRPILGKTLGKKPP